MQTMIVSGLVTLSLTATWYTSPKTDVLALAPSKLGQMESTIVASLDVAPYVSMLSRQMAEPVVVEGEFTSVSPQGGLNDCSAGGWNEAKSCSTLAGDGTWCSAEGSAELPDRHCSAAVDSDGGDTWCSAMSMGPGSSGLCSAFGEGSQDIHCSSQGGPGQQCSAVGLGGELPICSTFSGSTNPNEPNSCTSFGGQWPNMPQCSVWGEGFCSVVGAHANAECTVLGTDQPGAEPAGQCSSFAESPAAFCSSYSGGEFYPPDAQGKCYGIPSEGQKEARDEMIANGTWPY